MSSSLPHRIMRDFIITTVHERANFTMAVTRCWTAGKGRKTLTIATWDCEIDGLPLQP
jgi:hypothetical protein